MSTFHANPPLRRFRPGDVAYLRVRVTGSIVEPFSNQKVATVQVIDAQGRQVDTRTHHVIESSVVSSADAFRAVREALR